MIDDHLSRLEKPIGDEKGNEIKDFFFLMISFFIYQSKYHGTLIL